MSKNKKIIRKFIELEKQDREKRISFEQYMEQCKALLAPIRNQMNNYHKHGFIYKFRIVYKMFNSTWKSGGPLTIIGKVDHKHNNNCEYPNTPYYRITKAWKWV